MLGVDETACRRGQQYITLIHDLDERRLLFATAGRDAATIEAAAQDLREHVGAPEAIETVCMDMSRAYLAGVGKVIRQAGYLPLVAHCRVMIASDELDDVFAWPKKWFLHYLLQFQRLFAALKPPTTSTTRPSSKSRSGR